MVHIKIQICTYWLRECNNLTVVSNLCYLFPLVLFVAFIFQIIYLVRVLDVNALCLMLRV